MIVVPVRELEANNQAMKHRHRWFHAEVLAQSDCLASWLCSGSCTGSFPEWFVT